VLETPTEFALNFWASPFGTRHCGARLAVPVSALLIAWALHRNGNHQDHCDRNKGN
jgi:hypothetical protein